MLGEPCRAITVESHIGEMGAFVEKWRVGPRRLALHVLEHDDLPGCLGFHRRSLPRGPGGITMAGSRVCDRITPAQIPRT